MRTLLHNTSARGFSLVEMLVAVAVFTVVMTMSVGTLLAIVSADRKAQQMKSVMNNLDFAIENMARNLRVGTNYACSSCALGSAGATQLSYLSGYDLNNDGEYNDTVTYRLYQNKLQERDSTSAGKFIDLTAAEVRIDHFRVFVDGASASDTIQPTVRIVLRGRAGVGTEEETEFSMQTMVTQRLPDFPL